jgi:CRP-like cAMP-binding protein
MDGETIRHAARQSGLFDDLPPRCMETLSSRADVRRFSPGDAIYRKGDVSARTIALIVSGRVHATAENGYVVRELGPGEVIGEVGTISPQGKRTVTLVVLEPTEVIEWHIDDMEDASPELIKRLKDLAWKRLTYYNE